MAEESKQSGVKPKPKYEVHKIYNVDDVRTLMRGIKVAQCMKLNSTLQEREVEQETSADESRTLPGLLVSDKLFCSFCNARFEDKSEQRQHYKLDWHRYNLKQKLEGKKFVSEEEFSQLAGDVSSISGSDSEDECQDSESSTSSPQSSPRRLSGQRASGTSIRNRVLQKISANLSSTDTEDEGNVSASHRVVSRHSKLFFENEDGNVISLYKCILFQSKNMPTGDKQLLSLALQSPSHTYWAIIMLGGGHFAAGIFKGKEIVVHKTFHCYTVRAKQGGSQSSRDAKSSTSHPKSAGASLRRYNEASLIQHVQDIMEGWADYLKQSDLIFYRAVGQNRKTLFGGKSPPLKKSDIRLRSVPFPTRRATFSEVKRVHDVLSNVEMHGSAEEFRTTFPKSPQRVTQKRNVKVASSEVDSVVPHTESVMMKLADSGDILPLKLENSTLLSIDEKSDGTSCGKNTKKSNSPRNIDRAKPRPSPTRPLPSIVTKLAQSSSSESSDGEENEVQVHIFEKVDTQCINGMDVSPMVEHYEMIDFRETLCEYEDTVPQRVKNKVKQDIKKKEQRRHKRRPKRVDSQDTEPEFIRNLRKKLYTACKFGDTSLLNVALQVPEPLKEDPRQESLSNTGAVGEAENLVVNDTLAENDTKCEAGSLQIISETDILNCLNERLHEDNCTLLHIASTLGHSVVVRTLLECGADPAIKDRKGKTPYNVATTKEARNAFRKFMADYPEKYDYKKAQVPGPLTDDMEQTLAEKQAEKRRLQRKTKKDREKERKKLEQERKQEEEERQRFLSLSDREKRALAAERRFLVQAGSSDGSKPVLSRCFLCGMDITGKVPFEYEYFRFCTTTCLKAHRLANKKS